MLKEIHEQPRAIRETISGRISEIDGDVRLSLGISEEEIRSLERVSIIACGTSYHAGMLAKNLFVRAAGLPVDVEVASEFINLQLRPRTCSWDHPVRRDCWTPPALKKAKACGGRSLAITNVVGSTVTELVDGTIFTRWRPGDSGGSPQDFTSQLCPSPPRHPPGQARGPSDPRTSRERCDELTSLPDWAEGLRRGRNQEGREGSRCTAIFHWPDYLLPDILEGR